MSGSRQKSRKNKVILPKIMFYKQSPKQPEGVTGITSMENSDRLISIDRASAGGDPQPGLSQINQSMEDNLWNIENNYKTESLPRHEQTIDLIPAADANSTLIFDYEVQGPQNRRPTHSGAISKPDAPIDEMLLHNYMMQQQQSQPISTPQGAQLNQKSTP